jgi:hypothetical protein
MYSNRNTGRRERPGGQGTEGFNGRSRLMMKGVPLYLLYFLYFLLIPDPQA